MALLESTRRAKARLTDMMVQEVSVVDAAANLRKFVLIKRDENMADTKTQKAALKLPSAAKQGIMDGLAQSLDKLTALATMVGDAEVDDAAAVPEELGTALSQTAELIEGMAAQFGAPPPAAEAPAEAPPPEAAAAPPPAGKSAGETTKALAAEMKDSMKLTTELHDGDSLKQIYRKAIAVAQIEIADIEKAGRKIATARYKKLSELHDTLGKLLNELAYDDAAEAAGAAAAPPAKKDAGEDVAKKLADLNAIVEKAKAAETRLTELAKASTPINKSEGVSNAQPVEGGSAPPPTVVWEHDMSAAVRRKKQAAR